MRWIYNILIYVSILFKFINFCDTLALPESTEHNLVTTNTTQVENNESSTNISFLDVTSTHYSSEEDYESSTELIVTSNDDDAIITPWPGLLYPGSYFPPYLWSSILTTKSEIEEDMEYLHDEHQEGDEFYVGAAARVNMSFYIGTKKLTCYYCNYGNHTDRPKCLSLHDPFLNSTGCSGPDASCYTAVNIVGTRIATVERGCIVNCTDTFNRFCCKIDRCNNEKIAVFPKTLINSLLKINKTTQKQPCVSILMILFVSQVLVVMLIV